MRRIVGRAMDGPPGSKGSTGRIGHVDTGGPSGQGRQEIASSAPQTTDGAPEPDSVERFVADLNVLRQAEGNLGVKALARRMGISHGSVHRALSAPAKLPSAYVLGRMIDYWQPERADAWAERLARLAGSPPAVAEEGQPVLEASGRGSVNEPGDGPAAQRRSLRRWALRLLGYATAIGFGFYLAVPLPRGGVDVIDYCRHNHPGSVKGPVFTSDDSWSGWKCRTPDGQTVPVDMNQACRQQHRKWTPLGRIFADHRSEGPASWRCYGSIVYIAFSDG